MNHSKELYQIQSFQGNLFEPFHSKWQNIDESIRNNILVSLLALGSVRGIGFRTLCAMFDSRFLENFPKWDFDELSHQWSLLSLKKSNDNLIQHIYNKKQELLETGYKEAEELNKQGITFIPKGHINYPKSLLKLQDPPRWIFAKGNIEVINSKSVIGIVGTRKPSLEGQKLAYRCAKELVNYNFVILSGLAKGIDEKAHLGAIDYYGQTIAILGHGINAKHVSVNKDLVSKILDFEGAIISEYLPLEPPSRQRFLRRNELIAAMAGIIIPIETPSLSSGTGATIRRAKKLQTPVIGIFPPNVREKNLIQTKENLLKIDCHVFMFPNGSEDFWDYLKSVFPQHNWNSKSQERIERALNDIKQYIIKVNEKISLREKEANLLIEWLKDEFTNKKT